MTDLVLLKDTPQRVTRALHLKYLRYYHGLISSLVHSRPVGWEVRWHRLILKHQYHNAMVSRYER